MRIVVIGKSGQVARSLAQASDDVTALGRAELDSLNVGAVRAALKNADSVINAAAYTNVDQAESDRAAAFALNAEAAALIAHVCADANVPLIHLSTDYVFDGAKPTPYLEDDPAAPLNVYGESKLAGERAVLASGARAIVLRTSWVFASTGANFVETMLRLARDREELNVVDDQFGRATWARDLASACLTLAHALRDAHAPTGIFHAANEGDASRADFAEAIFAQAGQRGWPTARVRRIASSEFPAPAKRPPNSRLDTVKLSAAYAIRLRPWPEALALCLDEHTS